ncbi:MAG TPA: tetratricopeptide repeat protein, partial [Candidatus Latescibacteria bacterium]|nr:tetratricopeptide repeat protein [Candidatus Latescibacterota bacterium]
HPDHPTARYGLAVLFRKAERFGEALAQLDSALATHPDYADARVERGFLFLRRNEYSRAAGDFRRVLDSYPGNTQARYGLGLAYAFQRQWVAAHAQYESLAVADTTYARRLRRVLGN